MELNFNLTKDKGLTPESDKLYDTLVIGGGPAGLNAALYGKRKGLDVAIISERMGGQVMDTSTVENYLGTKSLSGEGLVNTFIEHVESLKIPVLKEVKVENIERRDNIFHLSLSNKETYFTKTLILATGSKPRKLNVPGEKEFSGKGVAYCAICDGPFFEGQEVVIAGGGNTAVESAIDLAKIASKVKLVHRSQLRADSILVDQLPSYKNIEVHLETQIKEILGEAMVTGIKALDRASGEEKLISAKGIFVEIGYLPNSDPFKDLVDLNERGEIIVDDYGRTNVEGVFAAGDITTIPYKQIILSAGDGAKVALAVNDFLNTHEAIRNITLDKQNVIAK